MKRVESNGEKKIAAQNGNIANHNAIGGIPADPFGSSACLHSFIAGNRHDQDAEEKGFHASIKKIKQRDVIWHGIEIGTWRHIKEIYRNEVPPKNSHDHAK